MSPEHPSSSSEIAATGAQLTQLRTPAPETANDPDLTGPHQPGSTATQESADTPGPSFPSLPGFQLLSVLGRGGMGVVYKARQTTLNRLVALKMIRRRDDEAMLLSRFLIEARAVARLRHPNIVQIHHVADDAPHPYLVLEFVEGGTLAARVNGLPLPPGEAARLTLLLARAMHFAHAQGIVHRDLKPANVLLTADDTPKVSDFGLAKQLDEAAGQTQAGIIMGTPSYMAPEQALGEARSVGPAADIYALGAILYELLTGRPPFRAPTTLETLEQVRSTEPVSPRSFSQERRATWKRFVSNVCARSRLSAMSVPRNWLKTWRGFRRIGRSGPGRSPGRSVPGAPASAIGA